VLIIVGSRRLGRSRKKQNVERLGIFLRALRILCDLHAWCQNERSPEESVPVKRIKKIPTYKKIDSLKFVPIEDAMLESRRFEIKI
jgi:hypothetical protein